MRPCANTNCEYWVKWGDYCCGPCGAADREGYQLDGLMDHSGKCNRRDFKQVEEELS